MFVFDPFPVKETKNLSLRRMGHRDINDFFQMRNDPRMHEYTDTKPDSSLEETKAYIDKMNKGLDENKWVIWAIEHKQSKKVIGSISIWNLDIAKRSGELGYGIIPDYQGKGLMKEALLSVIDYAFKTMELSALDAYTEETNARSYMLLENCKFEEINKVYDQGYYSNRVYHMVVYRLNNKNQD